MRNPREAPGQLPPTALPPPVQPLHAFTVDRLRVAVYPDRQSMGEASALTVAARLRSLLATQGHVNMVFAAAPSQDEFLACLASQDKIDWTRVTAFQMDEFVGLPRDSRERLGWYLRERLFDRVRPGHAHYMWGDSLDLSEEIARYSSLIGAASLDITCAGVGENGHLAFNEPSTVGAETKSLMEVSRLTEESRQQQVNDGRFASLASVPRLALTLTISALLSASAVACVVPGELKAQAVRAMLSGPITAECPASILRNHPNATLYLDSDSASLFLKDTGGNRS